MTTPPFAFTYGSPPDWNEQVFYPIGIAVVHGGVMYRSAAGNINDEPPSANWTAVLSGGGGGGPQTATVTLDNDQIKALPSTWIEVVPAPGAGHVLVPVTVSLWLDTAQGAYGDTDDGIYFVIVYGEEWNDDATSTTRVSTGFSAAQIALTATQKTLFMLTAGVSLVQSQDCENLPLVVAMNANNAALTLGNAANTLKVQVVYFDMAVT